MRWLFVSATYTFPTPSTATPSGLSNCPPPAPSIPHGRTKLQKGSVVVVEEVVDDVVVLVLDVVDDVVVLVLDVVDDDVVADVLPGTLDEVVVDEVVVLVLDVVDDDVLDNVLRGVL